MVKVVALSVLFQEAQAPAVRMLLGIDDLVGFDEFNCILVPVNLTLRLGSQTDFNNVSRLVVEEPVGVSQPADGPEKDNRLLLGIGRHDLVRLADVMVLSLLAGRVGVVGVHIVGIIGRRHFAIETKI